MREFYMDTNIYVSSIRATDPYHQEATIISKNLKEDEIQAYTSVLTIVETASVASRLYTSALGEKGTGKGQRTYVIKALRKLAELKVRFIHISGDTPSIVKVFGVDMPSLFNEALLLSLRAGLRTFDLMHLAASRYAHQMKPELGAFVTGDTALLNGRPELSKIIGMPILSPREFVEGLGLN